MKRQIVKQAQALFIFLTLLTCFGTKGLHAQIAPATDGTGTIVTPNNNQFDITGGTQSGANLFQSFQQFGLNQNQIANFISNPNIQNILGRVVGGDASVINGLIQVSGGNSNLYLVNPAGIIFGNSASLNVPASFTATTANAIGFGTNSWFNAVGTNNYADLIGAPNSFAFITSGSLFNAGNLSVGQGQSLTLLGGTVINTGTLSAPGGNITIAAIPGEKLVRLNQAGSVLSLDLPIADKSAINPANSPLSLPDLLTGQPLLNATGVTVENGVIKLTRTDTPIPSDAGTNIVSGQVSVVGASPGTIQVLGDKVGLVNAKLDASSAKDGGTVLIGGDFQGKGTAPNASRTTVTNDSVISANAGEIGQGGRVIVWSDQSTRFFGTINAEGGTIRGDGGFVEVSGKNNLNFQGMVYATAVNGLNGTLLLDPKNITIANQRAAYISDPIWGSTGTNSNTSAMNSVFGTGNWDNISLATGTGSPFAVGTGNDYTFIYLDGSDGRANSLNAYLASNSTAIDTWVRQGGRLFLNAAPNQGGSFSMGFGVTLNFDPGYSLESSNVTAVNPAHPIFNGPFIPAGTSFSGGSFAHATVSGADLTPLIRDVPDPTKIVLGEKVVDQGLALFGGMTPAVFHGPAPNAQNLRSNIISYTSGESSLSSALFTDNPTASVRISPGQITTLTNAGTNVVLQANNDITIKNAVTSNNPTGNGGNLTLQAGRSILVNANVTTDNGNLTLSANDIGAIAAQRDPGAAVITMAPGTSINAGTGNVNIAVGTFDTGGDVTLQNIQGNTVTVENTGTTRTVNLQAPIVANTVTGSTANIVNVANTARIQNGVDIVATGGTVNAAAGTYVESVTIAKSQTLNGAGAGNTIVSGGNTSGVFAINSGTTVNLNGLTIANGRTSSQGGGIYNEGALTVANSIIRNNSANGGAGIYSTNALNLTNSTVSNNTDTDYGAGVWVISGTGTITNSTISGNQGRYSAGVHNDGTLTIRNSTIANNTSTDPGEGGGLGSHDTVNISNSIIANNSDATSPDVSGSFIDQGNNLIGKSDGSIGFTNGVNGSVVGTIAAPVDPLLAPLGNYGGPTQTHALLPGSRAIDAGNSPIPTDQRGVARVGNPDIGAFESKGFTLSATGGTPQNTTVNTAFANPLSVTVNANDAIEPVAGGIVNFTAPTTGASASVTSPTINALGQASTIATANTKSGSYTVAASANGIATPANFSLTNDPGAVSRLGVGGFASPTIAGTTNSFTVNAFDSFDNIVTAYGGTVAFSSDDPNATLPGASTLTNGTGSFTGTLTTAGTRSLTATDTITSTITGSQTGIIVNPAAPYFIGATGGQAQSTTVNTAFAANLQATVYDIYNNVIPNVNVVFQSPESGASGIFTGSTTLVTDANGTVSIPIRANTIAGNFTTIGSAGAAIPANFDLRNLPDAPSSITPTNGSGQTARVNTAFTNPLQALVTDQFGNPIPNSTVTFSVPTIGASGRFTGEVTTISANTDTTGTATVAIAANTIFGSYTGNASVNGVSTTANYTLFNNTGNPAQIAGTNGTLQQTIVNTPFNNALQAIVRDEFGNPVNDVAVTLSLPTVGASGRLTGEVTTLTTRTDETGQVRIPIQANTIAGTFTATASVSGLTSANFSLTNQPDRPASVTASGGTPQNATIRQAFSNPLQATVSDRFGNPIPSVTVTFQVPTQGPTGRFTGNFTTLSSATDAAGIARVTIVANDKKGSFTGTAATEGVDTITRFRLTNDSVFKLDEETRLGRDLKQAAPPSPAVAPDTPNSILCAVKTKPESSLDDYQGVRECVREVVVNPRSIKSSSKSQ
ncbi:beta strand repeat-containing protein [Phormidesmis sp. 146-33]